MQFVLAFLLFSTVAFAQTPDPATDYEMRFYAVGASAPISTYPFFADVPRLLLYDLEEDPFALSAVNADHPELVERYTELLHEQWEAHRALSQHFGDAEEVELTPEQLEQLRALGYIR